MPDASTPSASAVLPLTTICGSRRADRRDAVAEVEVGLGPLMARFEQLDVGVDHALVLLAEGQHDLVDRQLEVEAVQLAQHAQREHVLAAPRIGDQQPALLLHRDLAHPVARRHQPVMRLDVGGRDRRVRVGAPHAFQQDDAVGLELLGPHPPEQHLLVEGHHQIGLVAPVGDGARADADAVAAGAGHAARRRPDLGGDDLGGPDAVAHLRRDRAQRLAAFLRALARVADDLDDVLFQPGRRFRSRRQRWRSCRSCRPVFAGSFHPWCLP